MATAHGFLGKSSNNSQGANQYGSPPFDNKDDFVTLRLTSAQKAEIKSAAEQNGLTISAMYFALYQSF